MTPTAAVPDPPAERHRPGAAGRHGAGEVAGGERAGQHDREVRGDGRPRRARTPRPASRPKTELVVPAGELEYGTQYAFTVVAVNDKGAGSAASPVSNTVVPFAAPGRPVGPARGHRRRPAGHGRGAVVAGGGERPAGDEVPGGRRWAGQRGDRHPARPSTGLGNGQNVTVKVKAVNEAGARPGGHRHRPHGGRATGHGDRLVGRRPRRRR